MKLHNLPKHEGSTHRHKRLGCGQGSGHGKTSGRGHKGMKARSGGGNRPGFEGGQMPLYRKLPHRGFNNVNRVEFAVVNVGQLQKVDGNEIGRDEMVRAGIIRANELFIKVLGVGEISKAITVSAQKFSASAIAKIEAAGGKVEILSFPCDGNAE